MAKTTKDCVDFLIKCAEDFHPTMQDTHEEREEYEAMTDDEKAMSSHKLLTTAKYWKRIKKMGPKDYWDKIGFGAEWNAWDNYDPPIIEENIASIRWFSNGPGEDAEAIGIEGHNDRHTYEVYEMKDGTLQLGDNFGD